MKYACFFFLPLFPVLANNVTVEEKTVSAVHASYEDNTLILKENVKVQHELGVLTSEQAALYRKDHNKDLPFSFIQLEDHVQILCKNQASLRCDTAKLDFVSLQGSLLAIPQHQICCHALSGKKHVPLTLKSNHADIRMAKCSSDTDYLCKEIVAHDKVSLSYASEFTILSDHAEYQKGSEDPSLFDGILLASPTFPHLYTQLTYHDEIINATEIKLDLNAHLLQIQSPKGSLPSSLFSKKQRGQLFFSAQHLSWNHEHKIITLEGNVTLQESHFGSLHAKNHVIITQSAREDGVAIESIHVQDHSILEQGDTHLTTHGTLHVDGARCQIVASSPRIHGKVPLEQRLIYRNTDMQLYADCAVLEYTEPLYELASLMFQGQVSIKSLDNAKTKRFALSDRILYTPDTKTIVLSAYKGKQVLFWDEEQALTISAKEVHIIQDGSMQKPEIRGIGNVRLQFTSEESRELKSHFPSFYHE